MQLHCRELALVVLVSGIMACGPRPEPRIAETAEVFVSARHGVVSPRLDSPESEAVERHLITETVTLELQSTASLVIVQEVVTITKRKEGRRDTETWIEHQTRSEDRYELRGSVQHVGTRVIVAVRGQLADAESNVELACVRERLAALNCEVTSSGWPKVYQRDGVWYAPGAADTATFAGRFELLRN